MEPWLSGALTRSATSESVAISSTEEGLVSTTRPSFVPGPELRERRPPPPRPEVGDPIAVDLARTELFGRRS